LFWCLDYRSIVKLDIICLNCISLNCLFNIYLNCVVSITDLGVLFNMVRIIIDESMFLCLATRYTLPPPYSNGLVLNESTLCQIILMIAIVRGCSQIMLIIFCALILQTIEPSPLPKKQAVRLFSILNSVGSLVYI